ncbi:hypothetical protein PSTG_03306 [Puccinia striiformis f. sp. tritici PST-78]|uniref:Uncharacterized protein n=1 Tax=Puccinia striiformis f. sp. tritici PST-78 TaxID=1165861 RepID=A0A0L0VVQ7_9BASI|nr:hypothetical protein PSTG_03306 [Puccinia striiformis f. sp. tritici PST-78]
MGAKYSSASRNLFSLTFLLGFIGPTLCVLTTQELEQLTFSHFITSLHGSESEFYKHSTTSASPHKIGQSVCGQRDRIIGWTTLYNSAGDAMGTIRINDIAVPKAPGAKPDVKLALYRDLSDQVEEPLTRCLAHMPSDLTEAAAAELAWSMSHLRAIVWDILKTSSGSGEPENHNGSGQRCRRCGRHGQAVSDFYAETEEAFAILLKSANNRRRTASEDSQSTTTATIYELNDLLINFLIICERHELASECWFNDLVNRKSGAQVIYNYLLRRFPVLSARIGVSATYLNFDFKLALQESPFTEELQGLLKHFDSGWQTLARLHLGNQLAAFRYYFPKVPLQEKFIKIASLDTLNYSEKRVRRLTLSLVKKICRSHMIDSTPLRQDIIKYKLLHGMLRLIIRYHTTEYPMAQNLMIRSLSKFWEELRSFDETIMLLSDVLKLVYIRYGETLRKISMVQRKQEALRSQASKMVFLTDLNRKNLPSMFSVFGNLNGVASINLSATDDFVGIGHALYRLRGLFQPYHEGEIPTTLKKHPRIPAFGPMIENILKRIQTIATLPILDQLSELECLLLKPELYWN